MSLKTRNYDPAFKYGANYPYGFGAVAVKTNGTTKVNVLDSGDGFVGFIGTLTALQIIANGTTKGTIIVQRTDGTNIATLIKNGTDGGVTGTTIAAEALADAGTLTVVSAGTDNATLIAVFTIAE